ncbi:RlpA-like double-psi beta-barrel-protein domain-containing protein-containing protein [Diplogelasinospora grovesii]|uniref:RlpA-like double-psi beta-barrel-protein domain-containing protein-containing protein n=1 Tax=Diplogelasinospora grovesii TaxID=303347 RepID=A0AAN6N8B0_9PEZI|nr:RlpA-like double-psi beta-barrel-protein domain-containing protein-containing protein [Diplogelasinospora grovesii]
MASCSPLTNFTSSNAVTARAVNALASYYGGNLAGGNCMFASYSLPPGIYGTALAGANWNSAAQCGGCLRVTGPWGNSIKVMVVDQCPGCAPNQLDLFQDAFSQIGPLDASIININYETVSCDLNSPLFVRNKDGASKWWFSMQVFNANQPVTSLDVSTDGGKAWQTTIRRDYNYFERPSGGGFGTDAVTVRITCANGAQQTLWNIGVDGWSWFTASGNC